MAEVYFHDLRHSRQVRGQRQGQSRGLMDWIGHDSERAAMIYLHGSDKRQQAIADTLSHDVEELLV